MKSGGRDSGARAVEFRDGVKHRRDVFRRHVRQDIVDRIEHETTARREDLQAREHIGTDLGRRSVIESGAGIRDVTDSATEFFKRGEMDLQQ